MIIKRLSDGNVWKGVDERQEDDTNYSSIRCEPLIAAAWFAVWTRSRHEHLVQNDLLAKQIPCFLPTFTRISQWKDRKKRIAWPLFPGYCFVHVDPSRFADVKRSSGVVAVLSGGNVPTPVPDQEIEALQRLVTSGLDYDPCSNFEPGMMVRVVHGPLAGIIGRLVRKPSQTELILAVRILNSGARVRVAVEDVCPEEGF